MIKITRFFYIHPLVFPLFLAAYFFGGIYTLTISYCVVTVHELFHLFAAYLVGIKVKSIIIMPFGMTLRLPNSIIKSPSKEVFTAAAGPFSNFLMACFGAFLYGVCGVKNINNCFFIAINIIIMLLNLMPALPLDGGRILRAVLVRKIGFIRAAALTKRLTGICAVAIIFFGIFVFIVSKMNMSLILVGSFVLFSLVSDTKNNEYIIMKDILCAKNKLGTEKKVKAKLIAAEESVIAGELIKNFDYSGFCLISVLDENMRVKNLVSEAEVIDAVVKKNTLIKLKEI